MFLFSIFLGGEGCSTALEHLMQNKNGDDKIKISSSLFLLTLYLKSARPPVLYDSNGQQRVTKGFSALFTESTPFASLWIFIMFSLTLDSCFPEFNPQFCLWFWISLFYCPWTLLSLFLFKMQNRMPREIISHELGQYTITQHKHTSTWHAICINHTESLLPKLICSYFWMRAHVQSVRTSTWSLSTSLAIRDMKIKTTVRYHVTLTSVAVIKRQRVTRVDKIVEKLKPSDTAGGDVKWCSNFRKHSGSSSKD